MSRAFDIPCATAADEVLARLEPGGLQGLPCVLDQTAGWLRNVVRPRCQLSVQSVHAKPDRLHVERLNGADQLLTLFYQGRELRSARVGLETVAQLSEVIDRLGSGTGWHSNTMLHWPSATLSFVTAA